MGHSLVAEAACFPARGTGYLRTRDHTYRTARRNKVAPWWRAPISEGEDRNEGRLPGPPNTALEAPDLAWVFHIGGAVDPGPLPQEPRSEALSKRVLALQLTFSTRARTAIQTPTDGPSPRPPCRRGDLARHVYVRPLPTLAAASAPGSFALLPD